MIVKTRAERARSRGKVSMCPPAGYGATNRIQLGRQPKQRLVSLQHRCSWRIIVKSHLGSSQMWARFFWLKPPW
jgi:hypothetical protein